MIETIHADRCYVPFSVDLDIYDVMYASTFETIDLDDRFRGYFRSISCDGKALINIDKMPTYKKRSSGLDPGQVLLLMFMILSTHLLCSAYSITDGSVNTLNTDLIFVHANLWNSIANFTINVGT